MPESILSAFLSECRLAGAQPPAFLLEQFEAPASPTRSSRGSRPSSPSSATKRLAEDGYEPMEPALTVSGQSIDKKSLRALGKVLDVDMYYRALLMADAFLGDDGAIIVCKAIKGNTFLRRLDLRGNNIQLDGGMAIASFLKVNHSLQELLLEWNSLGLWDDAMAAIGDALAINSGLIKLDLRNNKIGPTGIEHLATGLKSNRTLTHLDVRWNNGGWLGGKSLADLFQWNSTLVQVEVVGNDIAEPVLRTIALGCERNARQARDARSAHRLHDTLTGIHAQHGEALDKLRGELAARDAESARLARKLTVAQEEVAVTDTARLALETRLHKVTADRDDKARALDDTLKLMAAANDQAAVTERTLRKSVLDWQAKALDLEAKHQLVATQLTQAQRDMADMAKDIDRRKERERRMIAEHDAELETRDRLSQDRLTALEKSKDQEMAKQMAALHKRIADLEGDVAARERDMEDLRTRHEARKRAMAGQWAEHEQQMRREEEGKRKQLEAELHTVRTARDALAAECDRYAQAAQAANRDAEATTARLAQEKRMHQELQGALSEQLAAARAETVEVRTQLAQATERHRTTASELADVTRDKDRLKVERRDLVRELERLRDDIKRLEDADDRRRRDEQERLKSLESAFGSYVRGSGGAQKPGL
ncbi:Leucine-rich repeat-containing protein 45 [Allomyces javanicus]|nr:Leucine-rich repeat-containing protein 45 [Allomyces javanicus]